MALVGSLGDFLFYVSSDDNAKSITFDALTQTTASRILTHTTIDGLPVVEFAGVDADRVSLSGKLNAQICPDVDEKILELRALQDGRPRALTRGSRVFGVYLVESVDVTEERWAGNGVLTAASYKLTLIATRPING